MTAPPDVRKYRRTLRWVGALVLSVFLVFLFASLALLFPVVQTTLAALAGSYVKDSYGVDLRIERLSIRPFGPIRLRGVLLRDLEGDTLIAAQDLWISGFRPGVESGHVRARSIRLRNARFRLVKAPGDSTSNLTQVLDRFGPGTEDTTGTGTRISCGDVRIGSLRFTYDDANIARAPHGIDFDHVNVLRADLHASDFHAAGDSITAVLGMLSVDEACGFELSALSGTVGVSGRSIAISGMDLQTPETSLRGRLEFATENWRAYNHFTENVRLRLDLDTSRLQFADIAHFAPALRGVDFPITVSGRVRGTVNELKGRDMHLTWGRSSSFTGDADLSGLPDVRALFMVIDAGDLRTDPGDLAALPVPPFPERGRLLVPVELQRLGPIVFAGNFTGFLNAFTALGRTSTALGTVRTDLSYERDTLSGIFQVRGRAITDGFDLGRLLDDGTLGPLACDLRLHASGRDLGHMKAGLEGNVPLLTFNRYRLTNITVKGDLQKDRFNGEFQCRDPQLDMDFKGLADMSRRLARRKGRIYDVDFTADIRHADLHALNLVERLGWNSLTTSVRARGEVAPDSLKGMIAFENLWYCDHTGDHHLGDASLTSSIADGKPLLRLVSDPVDVTVHGEFLPTHVPTAFRSVIFSVFPALNEQVEMWQEEQHFDFDLLCKDPLRLTELAGIDLDLAPGTHASGRFDSRTFDLSLDAWIPHVSYAGFIADSVRVIAEKTLDVLAFSFRSTKQQVGDSTWIEGVDITGKAYQDEVDLDVAWSGSSQGSEGDLHLLGMINGPRSLEATLLPSRLWFGRGMWTNQRSAELRWDSTTFAVRDLVLENQGQRARFEGRIGRGPDDVLAFELEDVRMENLQPYLGDPVLHGRVSGDGRLFALLDQPYLLSYLCIDSLGVGSEPVGDVKFGATWNEQDRRIDVNGTLERDSIKALDFAGNYRPGPDPHMELRLMLDRFDLHFLQTYLPDDLTDLQGTVTGRIDVVGPVRAPRIGGSAMVADAGIRIDYLNTFYRFSHRVDIVDDMINLDNVVVTDEQGGSAKVGCTIIHRGLSDWNYNIWGTADHLLCLNTTVLDNDLFYGKGVGSGTFEVSGYAGNLEVTTDVRSERGTRIALPLGGSTEVGAIDFVRFVVAGADSAQMAEDVDLSGVTLDMNVEVTSDARFELIFDPTVGDVLSGSGEGNLRLQVTPAGDLSMLGRVNVVDGEYLFTLRNIVNKRFDLEPGGSITWYGDPFSATLDLDAVYRTRASLYDIMPEKSEAYKQRVPTDLVMHLDDKLLNPVINFDVRLPTVDENVRAVVNSALSVEQERSRQVFALIAMNRFIPTESQATTGSNFAASSSKTTIAEFASTQFSNWASQLSDAFDLGVNYRPGDAITSEEWQLALGTQIFNDRVQISTNLGVQTTTSGANTSNTFVGDAQVEVLLNRRGGLRAKAYNLSNDKNLNQVDKAPFTQGVGLSYRQEFNSWRELFRRKVKPKRTQLEPASMPEE